MAHHTRNPVQFTSIIDTYKVRTGRAYIANMKKNRGEEIPDTVWYSPEKPSKHIQIQEDK